MTTSSRTTYEHVKTTTPTTQRGKSQRKDDICGYIETAAYYMDETKGFELGRGWDDWLEGEIKLINSVMSIDSGSVG